MVPVPTWGPPQMKAAPSPLSHSLPAVPWGSGGEGEGTAVGTVVLPPWTVRRQGGDDLKDGTSFWTSQVGPALGVGDGACGGEWVGAAQAEPPRGALLESERKGGGRGSREENGAGRGGHGGPRMQGLPPAGSGGGMVPGVPSLQEACGDRDTPQTSGDPHLVLEDAYVPRLHLTAAVQTRTSTCEFWGGRTQPTTPGHILTGPAQPRSPQEVILRAVRLWLGSQTRRKASPTPPQHVPPVLCAHGDVGRKQPSELRRGVRWTLAILPAPCPDSASWTRGRDTPLPCGNQSSGRVAGAGP